MREPMESSGPIQFPFERGVCYPIGDLKRFESDVARARQDCPALSKRLRKTTDPHMPWLKLRNEELLALLCCAARGKFSDGDRFEIMSEHSPVVDLCVWQDGAKTDLQITLADPVWEGSQHGSQHHLMVEALNSDRVISGHGPFENRNGQVVGRETMISGSELDSVYGGGMLNALKRKSDKESCDVILVVYCREYHTTMNADRFDRLARHAWDSSPLANFSQIWFVAGDEGFLAQFQANR